MARIFTLIDAPINEPFTDNMSWHRSDGRFGIAAVSDGYIPRDQAENLVLEVIGKITRISRVHHIDLILTTNRAYDRLQELASIAANVSIENLSLISRDDFHERLCGIMIKPLATRDAVDAVRKNLENRHGGIVILELV